MTGKEMVLETMRKFGAEAAISLRSKAASLDGTAIIAEEIFIPLWRAGKYVKDAPVRYEGQAYRVAQAHDSAKTPDWTPTAAPSLFSILHTKDPARAKPYYAQSGTTALYMKDECMIWTDHLVWRSKIDNNSWTPEGYPQGWEAVE